MKLLVEIRNVYGTERAYPVNDVARTFARIAGTQTLDPQVLRAAQSLGFTVGFCLAEREVVPA